MLDPRGTPGEPGYPDHIEAVDVTGPAMAIHPGLRHPTDLALFGPRNRLKRAAELPAHPGLDLHEHHQGILSGHQVDLESPHSEPVGKDHPSCPQEEILGLLLAFDPPAMAGILPVGRIRSERHGHTLRAAPKST